MSVRKQITVTDEGLKKLQDELDYLKNVKRKEVIEAIGEARSFGDLSENSEYDEAKSEQAKVEGRISELEEMLKHVTVIVNNNSDKAGVGSRVTVWDEQFQEEVEYSIVGSTEADPMEHKLSDQSPIGMALIGKKEGETAVAVTPGGEMTFKILKIVK